MGTPQNPDFDYIVIGSGAGGGPGRPASPRRATRSASSRPAGAGAGSVQRAGPSRFRQRASRHLLGILREARRRRGPFERDKDKYFPDKGGVASARGHARRLYATPRHDHGVPAQQRLAEHRRPDRGRVVGSGQNAGVLRKARTLTYVKDPGQGKSIPRATATRGGCPRRISTSRSAWATRPWCKRS